MTKLPRDARAFARGVQMGTDRLWLIVEGRVHDRPFYDRLLSSHLHTATNGYSIRLAEQLEVVGTSAGGKAHLLSLYAELGKHGLLKTVNSRGANHILFAMDRDFDEFADTVIDSPHVMYTIGMDVEADILLHGDLVRATSSAYSVARSEASMVVSDGLSLARSLCVLWKDWIIAGACSAVCGIETGVRYSRVSRINANGFGALDEKARDALFAAFDDEHLPQEARFASVVARSKAETALSADREWTFVKGKWLASYVAHLIRDVLGDTPKQANVSSDVLSKTCLETVDFEGVWKSAYMDHLDALHAS